MGQHRPRKTPDRVFRAVIGQVFHGRLSVDASQEQRRKKVRGPLVQRRGRLPVDTREIRAGHRVERREQLVRHMWNPQRLQQQVVEAKSQIEGGVAEPRALGVEKHRTARAEQNIFGADVPMHDRELRPSGALRQRLENRCQIRMRPRRRQQVRFDAQVMERDVGVEVHCGCPGFRKGGMYGRQLPADRRGRFGDHATARELCLPRLVLIRWQILHREGTHRRI